MRKLLSTLAVAGLLATPTAIGQDSSDGEKAADWFKAGSEHIKARKSLKPRTGKAKNVILFVGDGMGISTLTAARILEGQLRGENGEENWLSFERFPYTGLVKTYNTDAQVPDSAGTASAFNTGVKTRAGVVNIAPEHPRGVCAGSDKHQLPLLAAQMEERGYATGIVSTARITHATPAAVYSHSPARGWEVDSALPDEAKENKCEDIASQLLSFSAGNGIDVALGGGRRMFLPKDAGGSRTDGRDLTAEWVASAKGAKYVSDTAGLAAATPDNTGRLLGLFDNSHMQYELDRTGEQPSLKDMSLKALDFLEQNEKGYYLMVEAGRVDHAHHGGNAARALMDAVALSEAVKAVAERVNLDETLILVTADHSHVFTIAGYQERGNPILGLVKKDGKAMLAKDGKPYTTLGYHNGPGHLEGDRPELSDEAVADKNYQQQAAVPLNSETHGGEDVGLFAIGPWAHLATGTIEQNVIYHLMVAALKGE